MRQQLEHLVLMGYRRNVTIQVLPFAHGGHPLMGERISVFSFPRTPTRRSCTSGRRGSRFLDKPADTGDYLTAFEKVCGIALPPKESSAYISAVADDWKA
ncbi:Scr1 family TA system antitoxin-like transcriptional regulator [Saccharopolyspora gregorii]|uniref:DUF5753 domain-containing protein n=1 Tax=Saccharopolyspora gregorii TaxID=33914 RepID=A0ABP6S2Z2_9PSEU